MPHPERRSRTPSAPGTTSEPFRASASDLLLNCIGVQRPGVRSDLSEMLRRLGHPFARHHTTADQSESQHQDTAVDRHLHFGARQRRDQHRQAHRRPGGRDCHSRQPEDLFPERPRLRPPVQTERQFARGEKKQTLKHRQRQARQEFPQKNLGSA